MKVGETKLCKRFYYKTRYREELEDLIDSTLPNKIGSPLPNEDTKVATTSFSNLHAQRENSRSKNIRMKEELNQARLIVQLRRKRNCIQPKEDEIKPKK